MSNEVEKDLGYFIEEYSVPQHEVLNNNPNLVELNIPKNHTDWHEFRKLGIGASEIGIVVGVNPYNLLPKLVEEKVGTRDPYKPMNEAMLSGLLAEKIIIDRWKAHDGTELGYIENVLNGVEIRHCEPMNTYILNVKYPFLFVSLDARVDPNQTHLSKTLVPYEWPLECKTIRAYEAKKWEEGVPAQYRFQIQQQMLVTETEYAELAVLEDGFSFTVIPFKADPAMQEIILKEAEKTYFLIRKLKEMKAEMDYCVAHDQLSKANKIKADFDSLLPLPFDEEEAKKYYSEKMVKEHPEFLCEPNDLELVEQRMKYHTGKKLIESHLDLLENLLRRRFTLEKGEYMKLGEKGRLRYFKKEGGVNYQLDFRGVKNVKTDTERITELIESIGQLKIT